MGWVFRKRTGGRKSRPTIWGAETADEVDEEGDDVRFDRSGDRGRVGRQVSAAAGGRGRGRAARRNGGSADWQGGVWGVRVWGERAGRWLHFFQFKLKACCRPWSAPYSTDRWRAVRRCAPGFSVHPRFFFLTLRPEKSSAQGRRWGGEGKGKGGDPRDGHSAPRRAGTADSLEVLQLGRFHSIGAYAISAARVATCVSLVYAPWAFGSARDWTVSILVGILGAGIGFGCGTRIARAAKGNVYGARGEACDGRDALPARVGLVDHAEPARVL